MSIDETIAKLMEYAKVRLQLDKRNEIYVRNRLLEIIGKESYSENAAHYRGESAAELLSILCDEGIRENLFAEEDREKISDSVMGALSLSPGEMERIFCRKMRVSSKAATDWLYRYSVDCDYVKKELLDKNPRFTAQNGLIVTINLAKPEFRDSRKAAKGNSVKGGYPACTICRENEGYFGRNKRALRTVSIELGGEPWFWQFSPYGYFYQHGIAVNQKHVPMHVEKDTFEKLLDFVDVFPQYFIGCNAALPRIGGSVLAHDHFQGGGEKLPIFGAKPAVFLRHRDFPDTEVCVLDWFGTAIRVVGWRREDVSSLSEIINQGWRHYENVAKKLIPQDGEGAHQSISPSVLKTERGYEMTLILRSNITSEEFPDGVFHAHPKYHVIKKEAIGLIEAQGLFILPGRLKGELEKIRNLLVQGEPLPRDMEEFHMIYEELGGGKTPMSGEEAQIAIERELGNVCERILKNTAVFKTFCETADFLKTIGFNEIGSA